MIYNSQAHQVAYHGGRMVKAKVAEAVHFPFGF